MVSQRAVLCVASYCVRLSPRALAEEVAVTPNEEQAVRGCDAEPAPGEPEIHGGASRLLFPDGNPEGLGCRAPRRAPGARRTPAIHEVLLLPLQRGAIHRSHLIAELFPAGEALRKGARLAQPSPVGNASGNFPPETIEALELPFVDRLGGPAPRVLAIVLA